MKLHLHNKALKYIGYYGFLSMEISFSHRNAQSTTFAREAYRYIKRLLNVA